MTPHTLVSRFTTARLRVDNWRAAVTDASRRASLARELDVILLSEVLAHLPPSFSLDPDAPDIDAWITARDTESLVMTIRDAQTRNLIGLLFLAKTAGVGNRLEIHLGYLLGRAHWGLGYASEIVQALVNQYEGKGPLRLLGGVDRNNPRSARVLTKAGFRRDASLSTEHTDIFVIDIP